MISTTINCAVAGLIAGCSTRVSVSTWNFFAPEKFAISGEAAKSAEKVAFLAGSCFALADKINCLPVKFRYVNFIEVANRSFTGFLYGLKAYCSVTVWNCLAPEKLTISAEKQETLAEVTFLAGIFFPLLAEIKK